jgi:cellulose synthase/poly-beta-1,6-N-acetylglucosamine synthase-like glycosyltransferase
MRCPTLRELPPPPQGKIGWPWTIESPQLSDIMPGGCPWPRISIVTPNYNYGQFLEETIRSVLLQGYPDIEYIMDAGSTDNSIEIIRKYEKWSKKRNYTYGWLEFFNKKICCK